MELELYASSSDLDDLIPPTPDPRARPGTLAKTLNQRDPQVLIPDTMPRSGRSPRRPAPALRSRARRRSSPAPVRGSPRSSGSSHVSTRIRRDNNDSPVHWTVARIRSTLHARGVAFHRCDRKFHLLRLLAQSDPAQESGSSTPGNQNLNITIDPHVSTQNDYSPSRSLSLFTSPGVNLDAARSSQSPDAEPSAPRPAGRSTQPPPPAPAAPSSLPRRSRAKRSATQAFTPADPGAQASPLAAISDPHPSHSQPPPRRRSRFQSAPVATASLHPPLPLPPAEISSRAAPLRSATVPSALSLPHFLSGAALTSTVAPPQGQQLTANISGFQPAPVATASLLPPPHPFPPPPHPPAETRSLAAPLQLASELTAPAFPPPRFPSEAGSSSNPMGASLFSNYHQETANAYRFQTAPVATASLHPPFPLSFPHPLPPAGPQSLVVPPPVSSVPTAPPLPPYPPTHAIPGAAPDLSASSGYMYQAGAFGVPFRLPSYSLATATPLPPPPHAAALEPPPVSSSTRNLILSGADIDLSTLLPPLPSPAYHRDITCGDLILSLKSSGPATKILSFPEFVVAFSHYTEVICSVFPHRRREFNEYLSLIAGLAMSYGGTHFYTYHKLFSAKCAARVSLWNQTPYWGALDMELHSKVFLGLKPAVCALCNNSNHSSTDCPLVNTERRSKTSKSTSSVPRISAAAATEEARDDSLSWKGREICRKFNYNNCSLSTCRYLHVCSHCAGAHAKQICPVLRNANKSLKKYLSTPVIVPALQSELKYNPNQEFCNYLIHGLTNGFHPGVLSMPSESFSCKNLLTAQRDPETVTSLLAKEIESGFMIGPFNKSPFPVHRINPIGIATRKYSGKKRLIIDLSAPHNSSTPSINSLIPLEEFSLNYHSVDDAVKLIKEAGHRCWLAKADITSAFKVMPIHPDFWHLFGVKWHGKFYFAVRLTFGCRSSPKIFDTLSEALCWILLSVVSECE